MDRSQVKWGMCVRTDPVPGTTTGTIIDEKFLKAREPSNNGVVLGPVARYGGDLWWVMTPGGKAPYMCFELDPMPDPMEERRACFVCDGGR